MNTLYKLIEANKVVIPIIQRDYAQGRDSAIEVRKNFLKSIKDVLDSDKEFLNLDFIYGYIDSKSSKEQQFIPLDGQQRLTTLWLIHWYFSLKENIVAENAGVKNLLKQFTYETRVSSKRFCESLVDKATIELLNEQVISTAIKDASWFMASWNNDPTASAMLNMIDSIHTELGECENVWQKLISEERITFDFIDIKSENFKLTDELYIKMNSRGKPLTEFENFKAQFSDLLSSDKTNYKNDVLVYGGVNVSIQSYFAFNVDSLWMDLFWGYKYKVGTNTTVDGSILNFIYYIAELSSYKKNKEETIKRDFAFLSNVFCEKENLMFLFDSLDFLSKLENVAEFYNDIFNAVHLFDESSNDLFYRAITNEKFEVKHKILLYAILTYCIENRVTKVDDKLKDFVRVVRNLLLAVRQPNPNRRIEYTTNLRLPNINEYSKFINGLIELMQDNPDKGIYELLSTNDLIGFTGNEKEKAIFIQRNPELKINLFKLEDHLQIQGNLSCFILNSDDFEAKSKAFLEIWSSDVENSLIVRAFLTAGDYTVNIYDDKYGFVICFFGLENGWNRILTNYHKDKENTRNILDIFLAKYILAQGSTRIEKLTSLIEASPYDKSQWEYYFVKYSEFTNINDRINLFKWPDDGFNVDSLGNSGQSPLSSYHINPYAYTVSNRIKHSDVKLFWGRYRESTHLLVKNELRVTLNDIGWSITLLNGVTIPQYLIDKYCIELNDGHAMLQLIDQRDRIEIAVDFIKDIIGV